MTVKDKRTGKRTREVWGLWKEMAKEGGWLERASQWDSFSWTNGLSESKECSWGKSCIRQMIWLWYLSASLEQPERMWPWWPWHGLLSASLKLRNCFFHHSKFCLKGISSFVSKEWAVHILDCHLWSTVHRLHYILKMSLILPLHSFPGPLFLKNGG